RRNTEHGNHGEKTMEIKVTGKLVHTSVDHSTATIKLTPEELNQAVKEAERIASGCDFVPGETVTPAMADHHFQLHEEVGHLKDEIANLMMEKGELEATLETLSTKEVSSLPPQLQKASPDVTFITKKDRVNGNWKAVLRPSAMELLRRLCAFISQQDV